MLTNKGNKYNWLKSIFDGGTENDVATAEETQSPSKRLKKTDNTTTSLLQSSNSFTHKIPNNTITYAPDDRTAAANKPSSSSNKIQYENWLDNCEPQTINDLAVHSKKINEVQNWLNANRATINKNATMNKSNILLLTGPVGSGKTATIQVLAKQMNYKLYEWITPVDIDLVRHNKHNFFDDNHETFSENQIEKFTQFLFRASRYNSLILDDINNVHGQQSTERLILIEDFPNRFLTKPDEFLDVIDRYYHFGKSPLVFIVTNTKCKSLDIAFNLFSDSLRQQYHIEHIQFNPIAMTQLKIGLKRVQSIMQTKQLSNVYKSIAPDLIENILLTCNGDIRNAIINLHFASQKDATEKFLLENVIQQQSAVATDRNRNKSDKISSVQHKKLKSIGCDENITMLHSIGRVFNPKYVQNPTDSSLKMFHHSPEMIADSFLTDSKKFLSLLHTNYIEHFSSIENLAEATNILSICDSLLLNDFQDETMKANGFNLVIRGLMVCNEKPITGWMPIKGNSKGYNRMLESIKELKKWRNENLTSDNRTASDYKTYMKIINK